MIEHLVVSLEKEFERTDLKLKADKFNHWRKKTKLDLGPPMSEFHYLVGYRYGLLKTLRIIGFDTWKQIQEQRQQRE